LLHFRFNRQLHWRRVGNLFHISFHLKVDPLHLPWALHDFAPRTLGRANKHESSGATSSVSAFFQRFSARQTRGSNAIRRCLYMNSDRKAGVTFRPSPVFAE
jgi:hypothetical protein